MLLRSSCLLSTALLAAPASAGSDWVATFGGTGFDSIEEVVDAAGGGFIAVGSSTSFDPLGDAWVARVGEGGSVAWEAVLGGAGADDLDALIATPDGGALLAGRMASISLGGYVVKLSSAGAIEWQRSYKGTERFTALALSPNGYYAAGAIDQDGIYSDACVLELDPAGEILWQKRLGGDFEDLPTSLAASDDGVLVAIQSSSGFPGTPKIDPVPFARPWLVKLDLAGNSVWQKVYNMSGGDLWNDVVALEGGGYVAVGEILAFAFFQGDAWIVRLDQNGDVVWDRRAGDSFGLAVDQGASVVPTAGGGFAVAGSTATAGAGGEDLWLLGYDATGVLVWDTVLGGTGFDKALAITAAADGDLIVGGFAQGFASTSIDGLLMRVSPTGQLSAGCLSDGVTQPNQWTQELEILEPLVVPTDLDLIPGSPAGQIGFISSWDYLCAPAAAIEPLGCGLNPAGSLTVSGPPALGSSLSLGIDNPLGTQIAGSLALLALSVAPDSAVPPCGTAVPGFGMAGPGAVGELLVGLPAFQTLAGTPWAGAGSPSSVALSVPNDSALLGVSVYVQGVLLDPIGPVTVGLTEGFELQLGN